jgi:hypothetical protein
MFKIVLFVSKTQIVLVVSDLNGMRVMVGKHVIVLVMRSALVAHTQTQYNTGFVMNKSLGARWCQCGHFVVQGSMDMGLGRELRIYS